MGEKAICDEDLLNLVICAGEEDSVEGILRKIVQVLSKLLHSNYAFVLKRIHTTNSFQEVYLFPDEEINLFHSEVVKSATKTIQCGFDAVKSFNYKEQSYIILSLNQYGFIVLQYTPGFDLDQQTKLVSVLSHLGKLMLIIEEQNEIKAHEESLIELEKFQQLSLEVNHASVFQNNFETGQVITTPHLYYYLGYSDDELPKTIPDTTKFIHKEDIDKVMEAVHSHFSGENTEYYAEFRVLSKRGEWTWVCGQGKVTERNALGEPVLLLGISQVISQRKKVELELIEAKERAEESDRLKSAFLANMSHEIRTPMNGILGFAEILKDPELDGDKRGNYIDLIEKSGFRMLNIINDLIDISKIESGQVEVRLSDVDLTKAFWYIYDFFKEEVACRDLELVVELPQDEGSTIVRSDLEKVYAILSNLVKNAIKYSDKGIITIGYRCEEGAVVCYVKDTGLGVEDCMRQKIFDRFVRSTNTAKTKVEGAGLGLSICKAYVKMLGGNIWVESIFGEGSTFYFTLPVL
ncbi:PAS domain-containing sensor histidine kinase [Plebeiibacterium sediminum]|uniref:histidine kinase n=1 Tax=Plebeiibacterium sediminum TaxID=2992112 RepID=A0AAE3SE55_9BACT|nr:PAS domain-containing sensor histidine kinase [Plebeiobacterium sediminum]MCW3786133.1 PAS domain-containing sensor histidine kinase [Plebeiobacterium sediminum]